MKLILVAYDGTDAAKTALKRAASIKADSYGVVSVAPTVASVGRSAGAVDPTDGIDVHRAEASEGQALLKELGVSADVLVAVGDPGHAICEVAREKSADLIILGSRDLRGLKKVLLGSVSSYVAGHAPCDVLIVR